MATGRKALLLGLLLALLALDPAYGIECFRCISTNSTRPFLCNEFLPEEQEMDPSSCDDVYDAKYCIKQVGRSEDGIGTKRYCSSVNRGNYCEYVSQPGDTLIYRSCVYTCNSDGCNPASTATPSRLLYTLLSLPLFRFLFSR